MPVTTSGQTEPTQEPLAVVDDNINQVLAERTEQTKILPLLFEAASRLEQHAEWLASTKGDAYIDNLIAARAYTFAESDLDAEVEYCLIDGFRVPRILHGEKVYLLVNEKQIPRKSSHLLKYIARLHIESGANRELKSVAGEVQKNFLGLKKRVSGRDVTVVYLNDDIEALNENTKQAAGEVEEIHLPKPSKTSWQWWHEYILAKYKKPTKADLSLAFWFGVVGHGSLTLGMAELASQVLDKPVSWGTALWMAGYSLVVCSHTSTYRNVVVNSATKFGRVANAQAVSMGNAWGVVFLATKGTVGEKFAAISFFTYKGISNNVSLLGQGLLNNFIKDFWFTALRFREKNRLNTGELLIRLNTLTVFSA